MDRKANEASDELHWRETYFIVLPAGYRPSVGEVKKSLSSAGGRLVLKNLVGDADGKFQSVLVESLEDHAAVEISYETGETVLEQNLSLAAQLKHEATAEQMRILLSSVARLDVVHFERVSSPTSRSPTKGPRSPFADKEDEVEEDWSTDDGGGEEGDWDDGESPEDACELLDPSCLLTVVEALSTLTRGLAFDPASGAIL